MGSDRTTEGATSVDPARLKLAGLLSEADWQELVVQFARIRGWTVYHPYDSRKSAPGWPDLVLMRPPELIFAELKTMRGRVTQAQEQILDLLRACGQEAYLWRPIDEPEVFARLGSDPGAAT